MTKDLARCAKCKRPTDVCLGDISLCWEHWDEFQVWRAKSEIDKAGDEKEVQDA